MKITKKLVFDIPDKIWDFLIGKDGVEETEKFIIELATKGVTNGLNFGYRMAMAMKMGIDPKTLIPKLINEMSEGYGTPQEVKDEMILETEKHLYRLTKEENKDEDD